MSTDRGMNKLDKRRSRHFVPAEPGSDCTATFPVISIPSEAFSTDERDSVASELSEHTCRSYERLDAHDDTPDSLFSNFWMHSSNYESNHSIDARDRSGFQSCRQRLDQTLEAYERGQIGFSASSYTSGFQDVLGGSLCYSRREDESTVPFTVSTWQSRIIYTTLEPDEIFLALVSISIACAYLSFSISLPTTVLSTCQELGVLALCYLAQLPRSSKKQSTSASKTSLSRKALVLIVSVLLWHRTLDATSNLMERMMPDGSNLIQTTAKNDMSGGAVFMHQHPISSPIPQEWRAVPQEASVKVVDVEISLPVKPPRTEIQAEAPQVVIPAKPPAKLMGAPVVTSTLITKPSGYIAKPFYPNTRQIVSPVKSPAPQKFKYQNNDFPLQRNAPFLQDDENQKLPRVWPRVEKIWAVALVATIAKVTIKFSVTVVALSSRALLRYQLMLELLAETRFAQNMSQLASSIVTFPARALWRYRDLLEHLSGAKPLKILKVITSPIIRVPMKYLRRYQDMLEQERILLKGVRKLSDGPKKYFRRYRYMLELFGELCGMGRPWTT